MRPAIRTTTLLILTVLVTACSASPPRDDRYRGDSGYRGDDRYRGDAPGGFGGPAPRVGESPTPRIPPGMQVRPNQGQSSKRSRDDRELCTQQAASEPQSATDRGHYDRAVALCLEARGYRVR